MRRERESAHPAKNSGARSRRDVLRTLGIGATATAAAAVPLAGTAQADTETNDEKRKSRYRETEHVKTFYRVNRYPS
jgi:hypothetical protein